ncbi:hypothetical protein FPANT_10688 [Fusarium pseudoanthophilum]|uniref:CBM-cenC domain-containing protein n=1 Tax=Fusarium pseudoanthophilum TaxID=48495 RepID=A0A8H5NV58_9HYPO|nr:hypothetical protein FPANT_10688 [Fusarium pseudoanthophilum]
MVSNKLIVAAFAALASVANASPCKPPFTKATTTSATETTGSSTYVETSTSITESQTVTGSETATATTDATTEALSTEASTTVAESATTTTSVDEPLLTNAGFEDGTTAPWQLLTEHEDALVLGSGFQSPASGKVQFEANGGAQYADLIIQNINKQLLKAGSYDLQGRTRVDSYSQSGDGCSVIIAACLTGSGENSVIVPASMARASAENSAGDWSLIETTCTFTDEMIAGDDDISVVFGFSCSNSGAYIDAVELKPAAVIPNTDTTTVATDTTTAATNTETSMTITTTEATTEATSTEGSTIATETATTTTAADADPTPLLINSSFDLDTTEPWLSIGPEAVNRDTTSPFEGPASGRLEFVIDNGASYANYIYQAIETKDLKAASYRLAGSIRVDYYTSSVTGDGCNTFTLGCTVGDPNYLDFIQESTVVGSPDGAVNTWLPLDTTCTLTEEMLSQYDYVSVTFGFNCANVGANVDAVTFVEVN